MRHSGSSFASRFPQALLLAQTTPSVVADRGPPARFAQRQRVLPLRAAFLARNAPSVVADRGPPAHPSFSQRQRWLPLLAFSQRQFCLQLLVFSHGLIPTL